MDIASLKVKVFCDSANLNDIREMRAAGLVKGITCNPSLCKKAGVVDYLAFCKQAAAENSDMPLSLEVIADEPHEIERQAKILAALGPLVYVKVPILNTKGDWNCDVIDRLSSSGINLNVTACLTSRHVYCAVMSLNKSRPAYVSVFAGRIADTGRCPEGTIRFAVEECAGLPFEVIWASIREPVNVLHAERCGAHVVTVFTEMLRKLHLFGKDLHQFAVETSQMFDRDAKSAGYAI